RRVEDRLGAVDRSRRPVEGGQESVARRLDLPAAETAERLPDGSLMTLEQLTPAAIAELRGGAGGVDDVGEQDRREHPLGLRRVATPRQELLHLTKGDLRALVPDGVIVAGQLHELGVRYVLGQPATVPDVDQAVMAPVEDE